MKQVIKISQVKNNPNNPRVIKDHDFYVLVNSIKTTPGFMEFRPVIIDYNNMVLCGNQRLRACIYLGHKEIWTDLFTQEKADEMNKEAQKEGRPTKTYLEYCKAITIVDNTHAGTWDWDILANEWEQTELEGWGLDGFPFEDKTLEAEEDDFAVPDEIKTDIVLGDLFEIGEHRLLCGDSTDSDQVEKLMNGQKADMVFTDPPYNINNTGGGNSKMAKQITDLGEEIDFIANFDPTEFLQTLPLVFDKNKINSYIFCNKELLPDYLVWAKNSGFSFNVLVWKKPNALPINAAHRPDIEYLLLFRKSAIWNSSIKDVNYSRCLEFGRETGLHPTMKPIELIANEMKISSNENSLVFDFFLGSGSTMVAAHQLKRKCYGMELDPKYCQVIVDRMKKLDPNLVIKRNGINIE
jgi:DNA modification methylase